VALIGERAPRKEKTQTFKMNPPTLATRIGSDRRFADRAPR